MSDPVVSAPPASAKNPWARVVLVLGILGILVGAAVWLSQKVIDAPAATMSQTVDLARTAGEQARLVAQAFRTGTIRQEFFSQAAELSGQADLRVATLKQQETFQREDTARIAWGMLAVPRTVVQAQAPVEYPYYVDLQEAWEFREREKVVVVIAPAPVPGTPAMDISALRFYTLEGGLWRDVEKTRDALRSTFTAELDKRAEDNLPLIRELARRQIGDLVGKWLASRFGDGGEYYVKVIFADEQPPPPMETPAP